MRLDLAVGVRVRVVLRNLHDCRVNLERWRRLVTRIEEAQVQLRAGTSVLVALVYHADDYGPVVTDWEGETR